MAQKRRRIGKNRRRINRESRLQRPSAWIARYKLQIVGFRLSAFHLTLPPKTRLRLYSSQGGPRPARIADFACPPASMERDACGAIGLRHLQYSLDQDAIKFAFRQRSTETVFQPYRGTKHDEDGFLSRRHRYAYGRHLDLGLQRCCSRLQFLNSGFGVNCPLSGA